MSAIQAGNDIGDDGATAIAASLKVNSSLLELHLVRFMFVEVFLLHLLYIVVCRP
jgi:hypothetical protein